MSTAARPRALRSSIPRKWSSMRTCSGWLMSSCCSAQALTRELGMPIGLYGDYAVGANPSGSETWVDQASYCARR